MKNLNNIKKVTYISDSIILEDKTNKYLCLRKINNNRKFNKLNEVATYKLISKDYEIYNYKDLVFNKKDLFNKINYIHNNKITYYKFNKELYKKINNKIEATYKYYLKLQDKIEEKDFPHPDEYLLINNISSIYNILNYSKIKLDEISQDSLIIKTDLVNKINYIDKDNIYFNYNFFSNDFLVYDLDLIYKNFNYLDLGKYKLDLDNFNLLLCLISIPEKVQFNCTCYVNTLNIRKLINYVNNTFKFCLEKDKEYKKANQEKFEEKNKDIKLSSNEDKKN